MQNKLLWPESPLSPFFRRSLLNECIGKKILNIERFYSDRFINQYFKMWYPDMELDELFEVGGDCIKIEFTENLILNITSYMFWFHLSNSCYNVSGMNKNFFNQYNNSKTFSKTSVSLCNTNSKLKSFLGAEIFDVFLLEETNFFRSYELISKRADTKIGGFGFTTDKGNILFCKGVFEDDERWHTMVTKFKKKNLKYLESYQGSRCFINYKCSNIFIDTREETIKNDIYQISNQFFKPGQDYNGIRNCFSTQEFDHSRFKISNRKNILQGTLIDCRVTFLTIDDRIKDSHISFKEVFSQFMSNFPELIVKTQLDFFSSLYVYLIETDNAIFDLMFGLDEEFNFVLIGPFDVVPNYNMDGQYRLLDKIISYLKELID